MKIAKKIITVLFFVIIALLVFGGIVMALWNWLIPELFNGPQLNFWQALGILALARILTGGMGSGRNKHRSGSCGPFKGKNPMKDSFFSNKEARSSFQEKMKECFENQSENTEAAGNTDNEN